MLMIDFQLLEASHEGRASEMVELMDQGANIEFKDQVCQCVVVFGLMIAFEYAS